MVTVISGDGPEYEKLRGVGGVSIEIVDIARSISPWRDVTALFQLYFLFRRKCIQIAHSTTPKAGLLTALAGWLARVPVRLHTFTGQRWVTISGPLRWVLRMSDRMIALLNTRVYADSESQRRYLIEQGITRTDRIGVIGAGSLAGVDLQRFSRERFTEEQRCRLRGELGIAPETTVVTFIGRITRDKGINELLQAVKHLREAGCKIDLLLIGPMDSHLEAGCNSISKTHGELIHGFSQAHVVGYTDIPERYLAITDILCLPSYREGFGTVVIEAAAMSVPTVGTRITGLSDAVVDEVTGLLVPTQDANALAVALRRLIVDPALRRSLGEAARKRCVEQFDATLVNRNLLDEYTRLLSVAR
jgi:glycosyltransferase involved in cell wall biosynthesis